ncbi:MAG: histidine phosphatase family protein [Corynebacterium urealyticum]|uniref:Histidine phosphatase family protein n=1 Tax=Corynebacterium urealyticum TaxID=43771 RepID=A0A2W5B4R0_9CORY|nr:MAG: histidine phosphatase family protein [Corynebacterium urealyticum]
MTTNASQRRLILMRHGETEYNSAGRMQGQLDTPLSDVGRQQARDVAAVARDWDVTKVVASDLERAVETASIVAEAWGLDVDVDPRFRETHLGDWQGGSHTEIDEQYPGQRAYWRHDPRWSPPRGETRLDVAERTAAGIADLMASDAFEGTVLVVAHGGSIAALTSRLLDVPAEHYPVFARLGNARWAELVARPHFPVTEQGDGPQTAPAVDGSTVPEVPDAESEWWRSPRWYLEGWNVGVQVSGQQLENPDEGGAVR